jgi:hypothetical protein
MTLQETTRTTASSCSVCNELYVCMYLREMWVLFLQFFLSIFFLPPLLSLVHASDESY